MDPEFWRLVLGLAIAAFHRPIADFIFLHEQQLVVLFRQRGRPLPAPLSRGAMHNLYFGLGIFVALFEMARIALVLP